MPAPTRRSTVLVMARPRRPNEPSTYEARPEIPPALQRRFQMIKAVLAGQMTISEASRELGIARVNMQTLVHRAEAAIVSSLEPRSTGPAPKSPTEKALREQVKRLEKQNAKLEKEMQAADDMMAAAGEIIRHLRGLAPESSRTSSPRSKRSAKTTTDDDPEAAMKRALHCVLDHLRTRSSIAMRTAQMLRIDPKTLRRWIARMASGKPLVGRRGGGVQVASSEAEGRVRELVIALHGRSGAESLARSVVGISRRRAAAIKAEVLTEIERDRRAQCSHVQVLTIGAVRGFDQMYLADGFALVSADAAIPYRTSLAYVGTYEALTCAEVLDEDFWREGPPLVLRLDRARCHTAEPVLSVLKRHRVLLLQGPPRYPQYYGQLERQNLEHRAWWSHELHPTQSPQQRLDLMKTAFNNLWLRPTLGWRNATQCWQARAPLDDDRDELRDDVERRAAALRASSVPHDLAMRLAIEQALTQRGHLRVTPGRKLLCD